MTSALASIMTWHQLGDKPLSEPMLNWTMVLVAIRVCPQNLWHSDYATECGGGDKLTDILATSTGSSLAEFAIRGSYLPADGGARLVYPSRYTSLTNLNKSHRMSHHYTYILFQTNIPVGCPTYNPFQCKKHVTVFSLTSKLRLMDSHVAWPSAQLKNDNFFILKIIFSLA